MDKTKEPEKVKLVQTILDNIYARKINKQYEILKAWEKGEVTGIECIQAIEDEMKILRIESDLINKGKPNG
jgi:O-phosphoseryl-tRNA(Cys) synthetase